MFSVTITLGKTFDNFLQTLKGVQHNLKCPGLQTALYLLHSPPPTPSTHAVLSIYYFFATIKKKSQRRNNLSLFHRKNRFFKKIGQTTKQCLETFRCILSVQVHGLKASCYLKDARIWCPPPLKHIWVNRSMSHRAHCTHSHRVGALKEHSRRELVSRSGWQLQRGTKFKSLSFSTVHRTS